MSQVSGSLHDDERKVLLALSKRPRMEQAELAKAAKLSDASAAHAALWLYSKGLVRMDERRDREYSLNKEGQSYIKNGLPEEKAFSLIGRGIATNELKKKLGEKKFGIAMTWLRRDNIAMVANGKVMKTGAGEATRKRLLSVLSKPKMESALSEADGQLVRQNMALVSAKEVSERHVEITAKGREMAKAGIDVRGETNVLTSRMIKTGEWKKAKLRAYDIRSQAPTLRIGRRQPYRALLDEARDHLTSMGFTEVRGPAVETEFWNFDALFQPQFHPARSESDTYYIQLPKKGDVPERQAKLVKDIHESGGKTGSTGWRYKWSAEKAARMILRTHTTSVSVRTMYERHEVPGKYFTIARTFRHDVIDATHLPEFYQCDGIVVEEGMTFRELLGMLKEFAMEFANTKEVRFKADYFPYTEPSVELQAKHPSLGWIELGGAGMFRPEVREPSGNKSEVMAWGLGFDRLSMLKLGISDIRQLFSTDLAWLQGTGIGGAP